MYDEKIVPNGTEVFIFNYISSWDDQDYEHFIKGTIKSSEWSDDLSHHGSSWYRRIYTVIGEDGREYIGCYGNGLLGSSFFMTKNHYLAYLQRQIDRNQESINKLVEKNEAINKKIVQVEQGMTFKKVINWDSPLFDDDYHR